jgi:hypothetical protein
MNTKDRKTLLLILGIIEILGAAFFLLMGLMNFINMANMPVEVALPAKLTWMSCLNMVWLAGGMLWLGYGTLTAKRWAPPVCRALCLMTCAIGLLSFFMVFGILDFKSMMLESMKNTGQQMPDNFIEIMIVVMALVMGIFYVILPAIWFFLNRGPNINRTCEEADPNPRWTDGLPLSLISMNLICLGYIAALLYVPFYQFALPFFGHLLTGWKGALAHLFAATLIWTCAKGIRQRKIWGWGGLLAIGITYGYSSVLTFSSGGLEEIYRAMGYPEDLTKMSLAMFPEDAFSTMGLIWGGVFVVFMLYTLRHFIGYSAPQSSGS